MFGKETGSIEDGSTYRRNRLHLRKAIEPFDDHEAVEEAVGTSVHPRENQSVETSVEHEHSEKSVSCTNEQQKVS